MSTVILFKDVGPDSVHWEDSHSDPDRELGSKYQQRPDVEPASSDLGRGETLERKWVS